jgi:hypothetical protein
METSDAVTKNRQVRHTTVARISLRQRKGSTYIGIPSLNYANKSIPSKPLFDNLKSMGCIAGHEFWASSGTFMQWHTCLRSH